MDAETATATDFPIIGLGASAGGLDALRRFFEAMPSQESMAFIVVTHLDPERESHLAPILERFTAMPVRTVEDGMRIEPATVYVRPSDAVLSLDDGTLRLATPTSRPARYMPINLFFHSLAESHGERAVCIILSGTGTDGTMGLRAIKEHGGMCIAQADGTAEHAGMRMSAIATGLVDFVLEPAQMPACLIEYMQHMREVQRERLEGRLVDGDRSQLDHILERLHRSTGYDFSQYKKSTVLRRVRRRMHVVKIREPAAYVELLDRGEGEAELLFRDLLIGVTQFFRGKETFEMLARDIVPDICGKQRDGEPIRVWVPGCSSGEETYSLAMLFADELRRRSKPGKLQIFGTDIDESALATARTGIYGKGIEHDIAPARLAAYFRQSDDRYFVVDELREMCVFSVHDLTQDPPFSKLDLISCRNLFIYFESALQKKLFPLLHFSLKPDGILVLGKSEAALGFNHLFVPVDKGQRIFRRTEPALKPRLDFPLGRGYRPAAHAVVSPRPEDFLPSVRRLAEKYLLEQYAPACVVVDSSYQCVFFAGNTSEFLQPPSGAPTLNLLDMAKAGLRGKLMGAVNDAMRSGHAVTDEFRLTQPGRGRPMRVRVRPLPARMNQDAHFLLTIERLDNGASPASGQSASRKRPTHLGEAGLVEQLEEELETSRFQLRTTTEDLETANEELQSSNEELMSSNEELQSMVEEMETSKEEIQSVNEELESVNVKLVQTVNELTKSNNDLSNLHASTHLPVVFLDRQLRIRMFTPAATNLFYLIPDDIGRSIRDIARRHDYADFLTDLDTVLRGGQDVEREVSSEDGGIYLARVSPYVGSAGDLQGAVATFIDVTEVRRLQLNAEMRANQQAIVARLGLFAIGENDLKLVTRRAIRDVKSTLSVDRCAVFMRVDHGNELQLDAAEGGDADGDTARELAFAHYALQTATPVVFDDLNSMPRIAGAAKPGGTQAGRAVGVAIRTNDEAVGVLTVFTRTVRAFGEEDVSFCQAAANALASAIQRAHTEADLLENQRRLSLVETEEKLERAERLASLGTLAAGIAHEINNPLNAIWMTAELAKQRLAAGRGNEHLNELLDRIVAECRRSAAITQGILSFARQDGGLPATSLNINDVARSMPASFQRKLEQCEATFDLELTEPLPDITANLIEIEQVLTNLVQNAIDHGATRIGLETRLSADASRIVIHVCDDGPGIPPAIVHKIFDPFFTTRRTAGGSGLGLSVVHRFVENLGGSVSAENRPGGGAKFSIELPIAGGKRDPETAGAGPSPV